MFKKNRKIFLGHFAECYSHLIRPNDERSHAGSVTAGTPRDEPPALADASGSVIPSFVPELTDNRSDNKEQDRRWEQHVNQQRYCHTDDKLGCCEISNH